MHKLIIDFLNFLKGLRKLCPFKKFKKSSLSCNKFESIAIEVKDIYDKQNVIIAEIYRVPNTNERISIERYDELVIKLCQKKMDIIIDTDQNFDLMKVHTNRNVSEVLDVFFTYMKCAGYDNIDSNILMTDISDHYPIIACMGVTKGKTNQTTTGV